MHIARTALYKDITDYFKEDALLSINTVLKVLVITGIVILSLSTLVLIGQFFPPLASFANALSFIATPLWSSGTMGGGFSLTLVFGLCLYLRQKKASQRLQDLFSEKFPPAGNNKT